MIFLEYMDHVLVGFGCGSTGACQRVMLLPRYSYTTIIAIGAVKHNLFDVVDNKKAPGSGGFALFPNRRYGTIFT